MGKANVVALAKNGEVYTFGMNNKGQCGRDFAGASKENASAAAAASSAPPQSQGGGGGASGDVDTADGASDSEADGSSAGGQALFSICSRDKHSWKHDQCMVCVLCGECTGYGSGCVSSGRPDRNPGMFCGCGSGDSGCSECGICRACAGEDDDVVEVTLDLPDGAAGGVGPGEGAVGAAAAAIGLPPGDLEAFAAAFGQGAQVPSIFH